MAANPIYQNDIVIGSIPKPAQIELAAAVEQDKTPNSPTTDEYHIACDVKTELAKEKNLTTYSSDSAYMVVGTSGYANVNEDSVERIASANSNIYQLAGPVDDDLVVKDNELYGT